MTRRTTTDDPGVDAAGRDANPTIEITSPRATAWKTHFETEHGASCNLNGQTVVCHDETVEATDVITRVAISNE